MRYVPQLEAAMSAVCRICANNIDSATWMIELWPFGIGIGMEIDPKISSGVRAPKS
jgi:hypothetical protein